jgi:class 3 adenylate cyclase/tetratricopeptide (TPR) repeat protein
MVDVAAEGTLTILFADVEGSTALGAQVGDQKARELIAQALGVVRTQLEANAGREVKSLGDGILASFASSRRAILCAIAIQRALAGAGAGLPRVRIGLNAGEAISEEGDVFGTVVNAAARVAEKAQGGEILVPDVIRQLVGPLPEARYVDRGRLKLKGLPERWRLHAVAWEQEAEAAGAPLFAARTAFVGRAEERAQLEKLLQQAAAGHGSLALIGGEPGAGKTRLAEEVARKADEMGFRVRVGRCYETEGTPPYVPFVEVLEAAMRDIDPKLLRDVLGESAPEVARLVPELRRMFPDIPAPLELPAEQERRYLFNCVRDFVVRAAQVRPQFLLLDDLHWGDESTLLLVEHLAASIPDIPALVIGTYRDTELDPARPLARIMSALHRRHLVHRVNLHRLSEPDVAAMLRALSSGQEPPADVVREIFAETEGNAFFVEEVFRHLTERGLLLDEAGKFRRDVSVSDLEVPEGVRLVIGHRLERLSKTTRNVLSTAAVAGRDVSYGLLQAMEDVNAGDLLDAVDEAEQAHLIVSGSVDHEVRYRFAHELIRQTLLAGLSLPRRQQTHLRVAQALESVYGDDADLNASEIAHHMYQAGEAADAAHTGRYLRLAAQRALDAAAFDEALRGFDTALELLPTGRDRERVDLLIGRGRALQGLAKWDDTSSTWSKALDGLESLGEEEAVGALSLDLASQLSWAFRFPDAFATAQRGLAALGDRRTGDRSRLHARSGLILSLGGFFDAAKEHMAAADELADGSDKMAVAEFLYSETVANLAAARLVDCVESGRRAYEAFAELGNPWFLASVQPFIAFGLMMTGHTREAEKAGQEAVELADRVGHHGAYIFGNRVRVTGSRWMNPDAHAVTAGGREDLELATPLGPAYVADAWTWIGSGQYQEGLWEEARASLERAVEIAENAFWQGAYQAHLMEVLAYIGDRDAMYQLFEQSRGYLPEPGKLNRIGAWSLAASAADAFSYVGDGEKAAELYPLIQEAIQQGTRYRGYDQRLLSTCAGSAAAGSGRWTDAERHFETALRECREFENNAELPFLRYRYGLMLARRGGDSDRARTLFGDAAEGFLAMHASRHEALARQALAGLSA